MPAFSITLMTVSGRAEPTAVRVAREVFSEQMPLNEKPEGERQQLCALGEEYFGQREQSALRP